MEELELSPEDIDHILFLQADALRNDMVRMSLWQLDLARHEKLADFHNAEPKASKYRLVKVIEDVGATDGLCSLCAELHVMQEDDEEWEEWDDEEVYYVGEYDQELATGWRG